MSRTLAEFGDEMEKAHDCEKCRGKIFAVMVDDLGNRYCGYCKEKVDYPNPTEEEMKMWLKDIGIII